VTNIIEVRASVNRFETVDRPPYAQKMAPIEYVICESAAELSRRCKHDWNMNDLRGNAIDIIQTLGRGERFHLTFVHCGYLF